MDPVLVVAETPPPQPAAPLVDGQTIIAVAEIEAQRDIAIAEQHTEQTQIIADASETDDEDVVWLRGELADLRAQCETNAGELSNQRAAMLSMQEVIQTIADQVTVLTAAAVLNNPQDPSTPEPDLPNPPNPSGEDGADPGIQNGEQRPPENPVPHAPKRQRKWL